MIVKGYIVSIIPLIFHNYSWWYVHDRLIIIVVIIINHVGKTMPQTTKMTGNPHYKNGTSIVSNIPWLIDIPCGTPTNCNYYFSPTYKNGDHLGVVMTGHCFTHSQFINLSWNNRNIPIMTTMVIHYWPNYPIVVLVISHSCNIPYVMVISQLNYELFIWDITNYGIIFNWDITNMIDHGNYHHFNGLINSIKLSISLESIQITWNYPLLHWGILNDYYHRFNDIIISMKWSVVIIKNMILWSVIMLCCYWDITIMILSLMFHLLYLRTIKHGNGNSPFIVDFPMKISIFRCFSNAMFDYQRVISISWIIFQLMDDSYQISLYNIIIIDVPCV